MRFFRSMLEPGGRLLARHLGRLCQTLQDLGARLRESIASAAGQTAQGVVREIVETIMNPGGVVKNPPWNRHDPLDNPTRDYRGRQSRDRLWDEPSEDLERPWPAEPDDLRDDEEDPDWEPRGPSSRSTSWPAAVVVGLQTAAWWLRRRTKRLPIIAAVGCGLVAAVIALSWSPLAFVGAGLMSLANTVHRGAEILATVTTI